MNEEEIKVGDYIRYNDGTIIKVIEEEHSYYNYLFKNKKGIFKHSPNIIDLIEEGDYVNGEKVIEIDDFKEWIDTGKSIVRENSIKSIVTKEQFEQVRYIVEE